MLSINPKYLPILDRFAAVKDVRFYLNGFYAAPHVDGGAILVATNGHYLVAIHDKDAEIDVAQIREIPKKGLVTACRKKTATRCVFSSDGGVEVFGPGDTLMLGATSLVIDGKYPDWQQVVRGYRPATSPTVPYAVQGDYLAMMKGLGVVTLISVEVDTVVASKHCDTNPTFLRFQDYPEAFGVIMPYKTHDTECYPDWFGMAHH